MERFGSCPRLRPSRLVVLAVMVCVLIGSLAPAGASAQPRDQIERERAQRQLKQAGDAFRQLRDLMSPSAGVAATDVQLNSALGRVQALIERSRDHFLAKDYTVSYKLSNEAIDLIRKIVQEFRRLERRLHLIERLIQQNREALELLRRRARLEQLDEKTARMLELAVDTFHRAVAARNRGELILAYKLTDQTSDLVKKVIKALGGQAISQARLSKDLDRTDEMLDDVTEAVGELDHPEIEAVLERARVVQQQALVNHEEGNLDFARRLTLRARTLARLALRLAQKEPTTEAERILAHTDELIETYGERIRQSGNAQAVGLLEDAVALQGEAWDSFHDDQIEAALTKTRAAAKLVNAASRKVLGQGL